jgi:hypothetical protein
MTNPIAWCFPLSLFALAALSRTTAAQDISYPAFGTSAGTAFDERAPAGRRIGAVVVNHGGYVEGLRLTYEDGFGNATGSSPQLGAPNGVTSTFAVPDGEYLRRLEIWYDTTAGYLRGVALETNRGVRQTYGQQVGAWYYYHALGDTEIVGLLGTQTSILTSLGVTTRPVLASSVTFGAGCPALLGTPEIRYRSGTTHLRLNGWHIVEVTNVSTPWAMIVIGFSAFPGGVSLASIGAPGCAAYVALDILQIVGADPNHTAGYSFGVPNAPALVGSVLYFQGGLFAAPNPANLSTSNAMASMIGTL